MTTTWLTTREDVRAALDSGDTPRNQRLIDQAITAASASVEKLCNRRFRPTVATRYFAWPHPDRRSSTWRIWFDGHDLITATTVTAGDTTYTSGEYFLEPVNTGPPYTRLELDLGETAAGFDTASTFQRGVSIYGLWGHSNDERSGGTLASAISSTTATTITVSDASLIGIGDLIRIGSERLQVTGRVWVTTGTTISADVAALDGTRSISVANGTAINAGEVLLIDSERLDVTDVVGNTVTAVRAVNGSVLAAHTSGATVYASRTLTVERGAYGTTAATASQAATIAVHTPPPLAFRLTRAEAIVDLIQGRAGYTLATGSGQAAQDITAEGLERLRRDCYLALGRKVRTR